jgi:hypothetical protein
MKNQNCFAPKKKWTPRGMIDVWMTSKWKKANRYDLGKKRWKKRLKTLGFRGSKVAFKKKHRVCVKKSRSYTCWFCSSRL